MSQILSYLQAREEVMTRALEELVALESPNDERAAVNAVGEYLVQAFCQLDADVERLPQAAFGDHLRVTWGQGNRQILLLGHMDTVWPIGELKERPFHVAQDGDSGILKGTGPGIFDLGLVPAHRLVFLFNSDEECGSPTSRSSIEEEGRRSEVVLVLEPSREGALVIWRKGVGRFEMEIHGVASHSGAAHERGVSAVQELAEQILRLEAMTDYKRGTTVNVGVVQGGSKVNVRPASAWAEIDLRVTSAEEGQRMTKAIRGLQPINPDASVMVSGRMNRPPWETSPAGQALFERAQRVGASLGIDLWPAGTGGGSDGNFTAAQGIPTLDGLGVVGDDAHAASEWVDMASLPRRAALLAELLLDLGH